MSTRHWRITTSSSTIDNIHTVLHQVLQIAVDDDFIRNNPSDNVLRELKKAHCFQSEKRRSLTNPEQELFLNFLKTHPVYEHWYPVFSTTLNIYADVTKEMKAAEFKGLDSYFIV